MSSIFFSTHKRFVTENKHEMFASPRLAQRTLQDEIYKHGGKAFASGALKVGGVVFLYTLSSQAANVIQNDITGHGHALCGMALGSLFRYVFWEF